MLLTSIMKALVLLTSNIKDKSLLLVMLVIDKCFLLVKLKHLLSPDWTSKPERLMTRSRSCARCCIALYSTALESVYRVVLHKPIPVQICDLFSI